MALSHPQDAQPENAARPETPAEEQAKLERLRQLIQVGLDDIENGRYTDLNSPEEITAFFKNLNA